MEPNGLDKYQSPKNPNTQHQLHWGPGQYGKGLVESNGTVHHWGVGAFEDGAPYHVQYRQEHDITGRGYTPFWISRTGEVESLPRNTVDWEAVGKLDPRLDVSRAESWKFGGLDHQQRALGEDPQIIDDEPGDWTGWEEGDDQGYSARRPFVYDESNNVIYIGKPGEHHDDIYSKYKTNPMYSYEGYIMKGLPDHPDEVSFYRNSPPNKDAILNLVSEHSGVPAVDPLGDDLWKFAWTEEEKELRERDPLAFERQMDWDRRGDVGRHPDVEWVPTHELKKFIEYDRRPGSVHQHDPERYQALADHIVQHGFKNPVQLEFNQDTGTAHMGEGNHRTWIALEHGIPAMPVRVNRSRRDSPTQIPVDFRPLPEWEDRFDPSGYHVPPSLKPSHIGLPTVPSPDQRTAANDEVEHQLGWTPGNPGKGLIANGVVHTWNTDGVEPIHSDYIRAKRIPYQRDESSEFWIHPSGKVSFYRPDLIDPDSKDVVEYADPNLYVGDESNEDVADTWGFF